MLLMFVDYYEILGIAREAGEAEIRTAFRERALQFHPDHNSGPEAHERFIVLREAYQALIQPRERQRYDEQYDRHKGTRRQAAPSQAGYASLEMARRKRATRYNRSMYAQRFRYYGSAQSAYTATGRQPETRRTEYKGFAYSEAYARQIIEEDTRTQQGYRFYAGVMRWVAALLVLFVLGMLLDKALGTGVSEEVLLSGTSVPWSFTEPGVIEFSTDHSRFGVLRGHADHFREGKKVYVRKSFFTGIPTQVFVDQGSLRVPYTTYGGRYDGAFALVWLVVALGLATILFRSNDEYSAYLGTASLIVSIVILGVIFKV
ncbi:MAG: hypothetical protein OHK0039_29970 [Bacteroidia bacterium]